MTKGNCIKTDIIVYIVIDTRVKYAKKGKKEITNLKKNQNIDLN